MLIGYEGYSNYNFGIADRRRILYWAACRGHTLVDSRNSSADIVVITSSSDLGYWSRVKTTKPIILDVVDGLIGEQSVMKNSLRGVAYWGKSKNLRVFPSDYRSLLLSVARRCDRVVCSSPEQVKEWAKYKIVATDILDFHEEIPVIAKSTFRNELESKELLWEGLPSTLSEIYLLDKYFELTDNSVLNILTNLKSYRYMNRFGKLEAGKILATQLNHINLKINLIQWSPEKLFESARRSKVGVLPILESKGYNHLKAENRLLIMWRLGLPVLSSPLASYKRVMLRAGIDGICGNRNEWENKLSKLMDSEAMRLDFTERGRLYLKENHSREALLAKWDVVLKF